MFAPHLRRTNATNRQGALCPLTIRVGAWNGIESAVVMTDRMVSGPTPVEHFHIGREEFPGRAPEDAATTEIAVQNAVRTIGHLIREERQRRERAGLPDLVLPDEMDAERQAPARQGRRARKPQGARGMLARLRGFRPGPVHALWAVAFGAVLLWPKTVLVGLFAGFVICLVGVALFGPEILERLRERASRLLVWRGPSRGARGNAGDEEMPAARRDPFERLNDLSG